MVKVTFGLWKICPLGVFSGTQKPVNRKRAALCKGPQLLGEVGLYRLAWRVPSSAGCDRPPGYGPVGSIYAALKMPILPPEFQMDPISEFHKEASRGATAAS